MNKKVINQNGHQNSDAQFSWPEENNLPLRGRFCLLMTCSCRDNPVFSPTITYRTRS